MKLIPDWRLAWRFMSVQASVLLALLSALQAEVLPQVAPLFPAQVWPWVSGGLALSVVLLRLIAQDSLKIPRAQLDLEREFADVNALDAAAGQAAMSAGGQPMPRGRLEQYLGAALLVAIALACIAAWGAWGLSRGVP
jgi:hypothetical protein